MHSIRTNASVGVWDISVLAGLSELFTAIQVWFEEKLVPPVGKRWQARVV